MPLLNLAQPETEPVPSSSFVISEDLQVLDLETVIHRHIHFVLNLNGGNKLKTARQLGISRSTLYRILNSEFLVRI